MSKRWSSYRRQQALMENFRKFLNEEDSEETLQEDSGEEEGARYRRNKEEDEKHLNALKKDIGYDNRHIKREGAMDDQTDVAAAARKMLSSIQAALSDSKTQPDHVVVVSDELGGGQMKIKELTPGRIEQIMMQVSDEDLMVPDGKAAVDAAGNVVNDENGIAKDSGNTVFSPAALFLNKKSDTANFEIFTDDTKGEQVAFINSNGDWNPQKRTFRQL